MRKYLILMLAILFLTIPGFVLAGSLHEATLDTRSVNVVSSGQENVGNITGQADKPESVNGSKILLADRGGHRGSRGGHDRQDFREDDDHGGHGHWRHDHWGYPWGRSYCYWAYDQYGYRELYCY